MRLGNLLKGQYSGCLCLTFENLEKIWHGKIVAETLLRCIILEWTPELISNTKKANLPEDASLYDE